jgi:Zn-finger nucleic acid-binding protein
LRKINLLRLSDLIFDYCPRCEGFFLDKDEIRKMNRELKSLTPNKEAEEYRAMHRGHLVRVDQTGEVVQIEYPGVSRLAKAGYIRVSVFFSKEMPAGMRAFQEAWPMRLAKALGLFWGQDIKTGDGRFDAAFRVLGADASAVAAHLDNAARQSLLSFAEGGKDISGRTGSLEISSVGVAYVEGPYDPDGISDVVGRSKPVIDELVDIAEKIEAVP